MAKKEQTADVQIRIPQETLEKLEAKGNYFDKSPGGIVTRIVDEHSEFEKGCPAIKPEEEPKKSEKEVSTGTDESTEEPAGAAE